MAPKRKATRKGGGRNVGKSFTLDVIQGPLCGDVITKKGKTFRIGRTKASRLQIKDDTVSEKHGEMVWKDSCWQIRDLGSSNGTEVNDVELGQDYVALNDGDKIRIGEVTVVVFRNVSEEGGEDGGDLEQKVDDDCGKSLDQKADDVCDKHVDQNNGDDIDENAKKTKIDSKDTKELQNAEVRDKKGEDLTVLEYLERECSSLQDEIMRKGMGLADEFRQRWNMEKKKLLQLL